MRHEQLYLFSSKHSHGVAFLLWIKNFKGNVLESHFSSENRWIVGVVQLQDFCFIAGKCLWIQ